MTATSINHRPAPFIAAAVAVVAIAAGSVAFSGSHDASAPGKPAPASIQPAPRAQHFHPTTSGGRVMLGE